MFTKMLRLLFGENRIVTLDNVEVDPKSLKSEREISASRPRPEGMQSIACKRSALRDHVNATQTKMDQMHQEMQEYFIHVEEKLRRSEAKCRHLEIMVSDMKNNFMYLVEEKFKQMEDRFRRRSVIRINRNRENFGEEEDATFEEMFSTSGKVTRAKGKHGQLEARVSALEEAVQKALEVMFPRVEELLHRYEQHSSRSVESESDTSFISATDSACDIPSSTSDASVDPVASVTTVAGNNTANVASCSVVDATTSTTFATTSAPTVATAAIAYRNSSASTSAAAFATVPVSTRATAHVANNATETTHGPAVETSATISATEVTPELAMETVIEATTEMASELGMETATEIGMESATGIGIETVARIGTETATEAGIAAENMTLTTTSPSRTSTTETAGFASTLSSDLKLPSPHAFVASIKSMEEEPSWFFPWADGPVDENTKALCDAAKKGKIWEVRALLNAGINVNARDCIGYSALYVASIYGHDNVIALLLRKGADVHCRGCGGKTALHCVAMNGHATCIPLLVRGGAHVRARDHSGWTPLHHAAANGHARAARALLSAGARANARDAHGLTPAHFARHPDVVEVFYGDEYDETPSAALPQRALARRDRSLLASDEDGA